MNERPFCHKTLNDQMAIVLMAKLADRGFAIDVADAEACVHRMEVAVETGVYPEALLRKAAKPTAVHA